MAREKKPVAAANNAEHQEEMTVVVFKFKGGAESMQKGFEAVNNAIATLAPSHASPQRTVVQPTPKQMPLPLSNGNVIDVEAEEPADETMEPEEEGAALGADGNGKPKKPLGPKHTFLPDFNLAPTGVSAWKDFAAERDPQSDNDKCLVASLWIQTHGGVDPFTGNHLFTCFRAMDWKTQVDMIQPLRGLKSKKSYYDNPSHGKWRLTTIGVEAAKAIAKQ